MSSSLQISATKRRRGRPAEPLDRRILRLTDRSGECWLWTGRLDACGYGRITVAKQAAKAHRVSYETFVGPIPDGLQIDHLCRVRNCVRPDHLEPVTAKVNMERAASATGLIAGKRLGGMRLGETCAEGHVVEGDNVYERRGLIYCLACRREGSRLHASKGRTRQRSYTDHVQVAATAKAQPGEWTLVADYKSTGTAHHTASYIRTGYRLPAYRPAGSFEAKHVRTDIGTAVYVRFVGSTEAVAS